MEPEKQQLKTDQPASIQQDEPLPSIKANAQPETSPSSVEPSSHSKNKLLLPLILSVALLLTILAIAGIFLFKNFTPPQTTTPPSENQATPSASPTPEPKTVDPTSDWKTYTSNEINLNFKYPPEFRVLENYSPGRVSGNGIFIDYDQIEGQPSRWMEINSTDEPGALFNYNEAKDIFNTETSQIYRVKDKKGTFFITLKRLSDITIDGLKTHVYEDSDPYGIPSPRRIILIEKSDKFYIIDITYSNYSPQTPSSVQGKDIDYIATFDQILSTFKFLEEDITADWKTYTSNKLSKLSTPAFSIQYPPEWSLIEKENDGLGSLEINLIKLDYTITISQGPTDGAVCIFEDSSPFNGPSVNFTDVKATEIEGKIGTLRYAYVNKPEIKKKTIYGFCIKGEDGRFYTPVEIGRISYKTPYSFNKEIVNEMDQIIKTLTKVSK